MNRICVPQKWTKIDMKHELFPYLASEERGKEERSEVCGIVVRLDDSRASSSGDWGFVR